MATADQPLVIILDSLDQLSNEDFAKNLKWLSLKESLPANVQMVVSTLPGQCRDVFLVVSTLCDVFLVISTLPGQCLDVFLVVSTLRDVFLVISTLPGQCLDVFLVVSTLPGQCVDVFLVVPTLSGQCLDVFLVVSTLPRQCRDVFLVVSSLPGQCFDVFPVVSILPGQCLDVLKAFLPTDNLLEVSPLEQHEGPAILDQMLSGAGRRVTSSQRDVIMSAFERCPLPLYLRLAADVAVSWRSYDQVAVDEFPVDVPSLVDKLFDRLETRYGRLFVGRALGYVTAAKNGLAVAELEDILSCDDEVLDSVRGPIFRCHVITFV